MSFIKKHKITIIIAFVTLIILAFFAFALINLLFSNYGKTKYGNRLDGIDNVIIQDSIIEKVKTIIKETEGVNDITYHLSGRIINFTIKVLKDTKVDDIKALDKKILENFNADEISFYDFQILVSCEDDENYPVIGYKSKNNEQFTWTGQVIEDEE